MVKTQILLSHPDYQKSHANRALAEAASRVEGVVVTHLEELYPDGKIDADTEVKRLIEAERIVLQFPIQWYSTPPLLKAWQDVVLSRMFYVHPKEEGDRIANRPLLVAATAGNKPSAYTPEGVNLFSLAELLKPLHSTAHRCGLVWQEPFLIYEANRSTPEKLAAAGEQYAARLAQLAT